MKHSGLLSQSAMLAFAAGITLVAFFPMLPGPRYLAPFCALSVIAIIRRSWAVAGWCLLGIAWHSYCGYAMLAREIPEQWEGDPLVIEGHVADLVQQTPVSATRVRLRFEFELHRLLAQGRALHLPEPVRLRMTWYQEIGNAGANAGSEQARLAPNQRWRFEAVLRRPRGLANPGTFDYRLWLLSRGFGGTGSVLAGGDHQWLGVHGGGWIKWRSWCQQQMQFLLRDNPVAPLLLALALGDRQQLSPAQREVLAVTGTAHLMVVSGLHVGLCAMFGFGVGYLLFGMNSTWVCSGRALLMARCAAFAMASLYAGLAGFALPTQRALIMLLIYLLVRQVGRAFTGLRIWLLALVVVLLVDPLAVVTAGFWLSFAAVLLLLAPGAHAVERSYWRWSALSVQWRLCIGLSPVLALWGGNLSLLAPLANLLAIPLVGFLVVPLVLAALFFLPLSEAMGAALLELAAMAMGVCWRGLEWAAGLGTGWSTAWLYPRPVACLAALFAVALYLLPKGSTGRVVWPLLLLPLLWPAPTPAPERGLELYILDVGQGAAVVVRVADKVLVYDAGPSYAGGFDTGRAIVIPFLRRLGISRVDRLIVSHADTDHSGGAPAVMHGLDVAMWMAPGEIEALGSPDSVCRSGQRWRWGAATFTILHPSEPLPAKENDRSCVLMIASEGASYLLAGDIGRDVERALVSRLGPALSADMLLVPHHGSATSSSWDFAWFVQPDWAVISAGHGNAFGHPNGRVVRRYQELGAEVVSTAGAGALHFEPGGVAPYRWFYTRYWHNYPCSMPASARASWWFGRLWWPERCGSPPVAVRRAFL